MTAEVSAKAWLNSHAAPQQDELAELKDANPDAYALVKALLTKRSLGLLDSKHPTASFQATKKEDDGPKGAAAYAALETPKDQEIIADHEAAESSQGEEVESSVPAEQPHIQNMFAWKPSQSAEDDSMVQNVLGAAAQLAPAKPAVEGGSLAADADMMQADVPQQAAPVVDAAPTQTSASQPVAENSYLKGLDLNGMTSSTHAAVTHSQGADLNADAKLFSSPAAEDATPVEAPKQAAIPGGAGANTLSSWLGITAKVEKKAAPQKVAAPAQAANPYAIDWNN